MFFGLPGASDAGEVESDSWKIQAGALQAMTSEGDGYFSADLVVEEPDGVLFFGLLPNKAWYRYIDMPDGGTFNFARFDYTLGDSDNFYGSAYVDDDTLGVGIRYVPDHWNTAVTEKFEVAAYIGEGSNYIFAVDADWEFQPGYGVESHLLFQTAGSQRGEILAWHNCYPDGRLKIKVGYAHWSDEKWYNGYWVFGLWGSTN